MVTSRVTTVAEYLGALDPERRAEIEKVRRVIRAHLPKGFVEGIQYGMLGYCVPLARFAETYNGQPLTVAALAAQKNALSLYLMGAYSEPKLKATIEDGFRKAGKKLDMGKSCVRFGRADDLALDVVGKVIAAVSVDDLIAIHERTHAKSAKRTPKASGAARKTATTKTATKTSAATLTPKKTAKKASKETRKKAPKKK